MKRYQVTVITKDGKFVKTVVFAESTALALSLAETTWPGMIVGTPYEIADR